jgi:hypothetical protein
MYARIIRLNSFFERLDRARFILAMLLANFVLDVIIVAPLALVVDIIGRTLESVQEAGLSPIVIMVMALVIVPLLETWLGQSLPFSILYRLKIKNPALLIGISATWFGLYHVFGMTMGAFIPAFSAGVILAYTFWRWRKIDYANAFWMTAAVHAGLNLLATAFSLIQ